MDPQATLQAWIDADSDDTQTRDELARAYNTWRSRGGYPATLSESLKVERMHRYTLTVSRVDHYTTGGR